jgi:LysR family transcriptional regulator, transcriptional activator for dmlA
MNHTDLELVLTISLTGSLRETAELLGLSAPAVTKRLAWIESSLGAKLFQRTTRRVNLTAAGDLICQRAPDMLAQWHRLQAEISNHIQIPRGRLRLASTLGFGRIWVGPALSDFLRQHSSIEIELTLTENLPDLERERYDGAVWLWSVTARHAQTWITRQLAKNQRVMVAAPDYLRRFDPPQTVADLRQHRCLVVNEHEQRGDVWRLQRISARTPQTESVRVNSVFTSNSGELARDWCLAGQGVMLRSLWDVYPHIKSGRLVRLLPDWAMLDADVHWIAPPQAAQSKPLRLLIDFLVDRFKHEPWRQ